jgi:RND family efflux transporter MFP subunit
MIIPECDCSKPMSTRTRILVFTLCLLVLGAGVMLALRFVQTRPVPSQRPPSRIAPLVEVTTVEAGTHTVVIQALGSVTPSRQAGIRAEVTGTVQEISPVFLPGSVVKASTLLVRLSPEDYELTVAARQADLDSALAALELELGHQRVARHEWELMTRQKESLADAALALRQPQLSQAKAKVRQAETALDQARLNLKRTAITAPFTAMILEKHVDLGSRVSNTDVLATLVDTREFWIEALVPVDRLGWLTLPTDNRPGSAVRVRSQASGAEGRGQLLRLRGDLEEQGRLARIIVRLPAPLEAKPTPFLLGEYVRLEIEGAVLDNVISLPRIALREDNTVWTVQNSTLHIRPVEVVWQDTDTAFITAGLPSGSQVVVSELSTPIQNMAVVTNAAGE